MAEPLTADFSYENDVSPYTSRLLGQIGSNRDLSADTKLRLQGKLLGNAMEIEKQRLDLESSRTQADLRRLQLSEGQSAIENARLKRIRAEQDASKIGTVKQEVQGILSSGLPYQEKQARITQLQLAYVDNTEPAIQDALKIGASSIPQPKEISAATQLQAGRYNVPPEVMATGDSFLIGRFVGDAIKKEEEATLGAKMAQADQKEKKRIVQETEDQIIGSELEFVKTEDGEVTDWLAPESTAKVGLLVDAYGSPEDKKLFEQTRTADSDLQRRELFYKIRSRVLLDRVKAQDSGKSDLKDIFGLR